MWKSEQSFSANLGPVWRNVMVPIMPHVDVPGDNVRPLDHAGVRPRIMARSGQLRGIDIDAERAVWCFGFTHGSEAYNAYRVSLPPSGPLFLWVLSTIEGEVIETVANCAAIDLPPNFRAVIQWDPRPVPNDDGESIGTLGRWCDHG